MKINKYLKIACAIVLLLTFLLIYNYSSDNGDFKTNSLEVTVSAYTSRRRETDKTPYLAAWANKLKPGVKSVAISRDLLKLGIGNKTKIRIEGLAGTYTVLDKMNKRWSHRVDIYMGNDVRKAKKWGKKKLTIHWQNSNN